METSNFDAWDWIKAATEAGWIDPGFTEPLHVTEARAKQYLRDRQSRLLDIPDFLRNQDNLKAERASKDGEG